MDKILIFGDSIAYGKWDFEGGWVSRLRKYIDETFNIGKGGNSQVYNLGIPGEVAIRMKNRFEIELLQRIDSEGNNLVIFAIGINDSCPNNWMTGQQTPESDFKSALNEMVTVAKKHKCKVAFIGLTPVNPAKAKKLLFSDDAVKVYDNYISEVAQGNGVLKLNLFNELKGMNFAEKLVDSVHPNDEGHQILFEKIKDFLSLNFTK
jgi:lysophospholipase L1-like esterase